MNNFDNLLQTLQESGLSENEARVYLAGLSAGPATVLKLARASGVKRTTIYTVLDVLEKKGLFSIELKGFKKRYVAEDPQRLKNVFKEREEHLFESLPEFQALYNLKGGEGFIKYYEGLASVKGLYTDLLKIVRPHEPYYAISDTAKWYALDERFFTDFVEKRAQMNLGVQVITTDSPKAREQKRFERNFGIEVKIFPSDITLSVNTVITPLRLIIHQITPPIFAIVIENRSIIQLHQELFKNLWKLLP